MAKERLYGGKWSDYGGPEFEVFVTVDTYRMKTAIRRAMKSKTGKATAMGGAVIVEANRPAKAKG